MIRPALAFHLTTALFLVQCGDAATSDPTVLEPTDTGVDAGSVALDAAAPEDAGFDPSPEPGVVETRQGAVIGTQVADTLVFLGVPYAAPPTGPRRWSAPEAPPNFDGRFMATDFGPRCPQTDSDGQPTGSEDCLHLNIWTPTDAPGRRRLPVLFFIHGGGNVRGSTREVLYDGRPLSEDHDVLVVTINYRLGALGYLVHPELDTADEPSGNYGILDQIRALQWVRDNIANFGGDPDRVMIFGESAGARNTCILVASPGASGLFAAALMQSGPCTARTRANVSATSRVQIERSGCAEAAGGEIACLRGKTAMEIIQDNPPVVVVGAPNDNPGPHVDGRVIPAQPYARIAAGEHHRVPMVIGSNADETSRSVPSLPTAADYEAQVRSQFGALADVILSQYPAMDFSSPRAAFVALTTDAQFTCNARADARAFAQGQTEPVFRYFWTQGLDAAPRLAPFGAYHAVELFFVFQTLRLAGYQPTDAETQLAERVGEYWTELATTGDPNGTGDMTWPTYDSATEPVLVFDADGIQTATGIRAARCDFWDQWLGR